MAKTTSKSHYPLDIVLKSNPLVEAWLTVQWQLEELQSEPLMARDPGFDFSFVMRFFENVRRKYRILHELDTTKVPIEISPHQPRFQFRSGKENMWPVLQLGPGIATVNFTKPYTWSLFEEQALFLREQLVKTYLIGDLHTRLVSLCYRNAVPHQYSSENALKFLKGSLNTVIRTPPYIPGGAARRASPSGMDLTLVYDLNSPTGKGRLRITTGTKRDSEQNDGESTAEEHIVFELEIASTGEDAPRLSSASEFENWLNEAHKVTHDWFFSLVDGELFERYHQGRE